MAARQFGVLTHAQLLGLGMSPDAIKHRMARGKLHRVHRGVYAVGRPELDRSGERKAALLACSPGTALSHSAAAEYWSVGSRAAKLELTVCPPRKLDRPGLTIHRSRTLTVAETITLRGITVTDPLRTLVDMAPRWQGKRLDDAIERMSQLDLRSPPQLLAQLNERASVPGSGIVRAALTRWTISLTDTQLERRFLPIARRAGLGEPLRQQHLNGYRVDFYFPDLGLVVEADSLRYHRTAARQTADAKRDQAHIAAGLIPIRFSHAQITYEPRSVEATLRTVASRLRPELERPAARCR